MIKLAKKYLDNKLKASKDPELLKDGMEEIYEVKWEEMENMHILKVWWMFANLRYANAMNLYKKMGIFYKEREKYLNPDRTPNEEKIKEKIEDIKKEVREMNPFEDEKMTIYTRNHNQGKHLKQAPEIEKLFNEIKTYCSYVTAAVDERDKKIYLTMMEYSLDYYEEKHMMQMAPAYEPYMMEDYGEGRLFLTEKRYWPKDEKIQKEMEVATEKAEKLRKADKSEESHFLNDYYDMFEYSFGSEKWIKYFFDKSPKIKKKYKGYKVEILLDFDPIITGISELIEYKHLNWIVE